MTMRYSSDYLGVRATQDLVNRQDILDEILAAVADHSRSYVFYITGEGGMGKTFLVRHILKRLRPDNETEQREDRLLVARDVVDLYHAANHSVEGLTSALYAELDLAPGDMEVYRQKRVEFERKKGDLAGMLRELSTMREGVAQAFLDDLNGLAADRRLVIAFDTAEKLLYETDQIQEILGMAQQGIAVQEWLVKSLLAKLQNAVVLIAGRPKPEQLGHELAKHLPDRLEKCTLEGFDNARDCSKYIDAVAKAVEAKDAEAAANIRAIPDDTRQVIRLYTEGRPILLSLMIDYLIETSELLPAVKVSLEEARSKSQDELKMITEVVERELVSHFQNTGRPADDAIRALAWVRKGLDAEMLAKIADMDLKEAEDQLEKLRELSFVKLRPADQRVFLHDEMYEMLQRHVLAHLPLARREKVFNAILSSYEVRIEEARKSQFITIKPRPDKQGAGQNGSRQEMISAQDEPNVPLSDLIAEEVYYRFRRDPQDGFKAYRLYRQEAFWVGDESLDMELRSEVLSFLAEHRGRTEVGGLKLDLVTVDAALSWVDRLVTNNEAAAALKLLRTAREIPQLMEAQTELSVAQFDAAEGRALVYWGEHLDKAEAKLKSAISGMRSAHPVDEFDDYQRNVSLADALNTLGFLYRNAGLYSESVSMYREALSLWRKLVEREQSETLDRAIQTQHANTLNNLSWPLTMVGNTLSAINTCRDALELRRNLGPSVPLAFSFNTMGLILLRTNHPVPIDALEYCTRALKIMVDFEHPRGVGMACTALAEAHRRRASGSKDLLSLDERQGHYGRADEYAAKAEEIFDRSIKHPPSLIEALIECGCTFRDWAWMLHEEDPAAQEIQELVHKSEQAFRRAIRVGEKETQLLHMVVDAHVNLAWLYYYVDMDTEALREDEDAIRQVPEGYWITKDTGLPKLNLPLKSLWVQLSKAQFLLGMLTLRRFQKIKDNHHLAEAAEHFTLSLEYADLFAPDFRDARRAKETMYHSLKRLNQREFDVVLRTIDTTVETYGLRQRDLRPAHFRRFLDDSFGSLSQS